MEVVRALFAAYRTQDRAAAEALVAPEFVFTSPQDDHIDRSEWFARCFPTADRFVTQELLDVVESAPGRVCVRYEYVLAGAGGRWRNMECTTVVADRVVETEVFFGGRAD